MPSDAIAEALQERMLTALAAGRERFVVWGGGTEGLRLLSRLARDHLLTTVVKVVDHRAHMIGRNAFGFRIEAPSVLPGIEYDAVVISLDSDKEEALAALAQVEHRLPMVLFSGSANYEFRDPVFDQLVASSPVRSKAGGHPHALIHLYQALKYVCARGLEGDVAEFGVFQGGTTVFIAKVLAHFGHPARVYGFDTFGGFPPSKSVLDLYSDPKCEFADFDAVERYCSPYNITLVRGDICDTSTKLIDIPLIFSFFDTDNYSPVKSALDLCYDRTVSGGVLAFDHFYSPAWGDTVGERIAIREVLAGKPVFNLHGTGIFVKP